MQQELGAARNGSHGGKNSINNYIDWILLICLNVQQYQRRIKQNKANHSRQSFPITLVNFRAGTKPVWTIRYH